MFSPTSQDKAADGRDESGQERIEGECSDEAAVDKLEDSRQQDVEEICVDELQLLGRLAAVFANEFGHHCL